MSGPKRRGARKAGIDHLLHRRAVGDVALLQGNVAADRLHPRDGFLSGLQVAVDGKNLCAFFSESYGDGTSISPSRSDTSGAGHDGNTSLQAAAHAKVSLSLNANMRFAVSQNSLRRSASFGNSSAANSSSGP